MKQGLTTLPFFFLLLLLSSCSCSSATLSKIGLLTDFKNSVDNADDFQKWAAVLNERGGQSGEVNFVFDNYQSKAYIVAAPDFLSSLNGIFKSKNNYSCPERSKYCSICINLNDLSLDCKAERDIPLGAERGVLTAKQTVTLRDVIVAGGKRRETRMVFSGYPAELMFGKSSHGLCRHCFLKKLMSLSHKRKINDASCFTDKKIFVCEALVSVKKL
jgi:hypothetical protein